MKEKNEGFVLLWRKIQHNQLWLREPFTRGQAWVDLFMLANHEDGSIIIRGNIVEIKRGQLGWSEESLAERWKWSRGKVKRYLNYLIMIQQIERQESHIISLITVKNYERYQAKKTTNDTTDDTTDGHQTVQQTDTNNNGNNETSNILVPNGTEKSMYIEPTINLDENGEEVSLPHKRNTFGKFPAKIAGYYCAKLGKTDGSAQLKAAKKLMELAQQGNPDETIEDWAREVKGRIDVAFKYYEKVKKVNDWNLQKVAENWEKILTQWDKELSKYV